MFEGHWDISVLLLAILAGVLKVDRTLTRLSLKQSDHEKRITSLERLVGKLHEWWIASTKAKEVKPS